MQRKKYLKKADSTIIAVQLNLDFDGFGFRKWGNDQWCKAGDWLVNNNGEVYTVEKEIFSQSYQEVSPGNFIKVKPIWAEIAADAGAVETLEGHTNYEPGDYLVAEIEDGPFAYCVKPEKFNSMYELVE